MIDLLDILYSKELISQVARQLVLSYSDRWNLTIYQSLLQTHTVEEPDLARISAEALSSTLILSIDPTEVDHGGLQALSYQEAKKHNAIIVKPYGDKIKRLVVSDVTDPLLPSLLKSIKITCKLAIAEQSLISDAIDRYYPIENQLPSIFRK